MKHRGLWSLLSLKKLIVKSLSISPARTYHLHWLLAPHALFRAYAAKGSWSKMLHFRTCTGCRDNKFMFILKFFLREKQDYLQGILLSEAPERFLPHISVEGAHHIQNLEKKDQGVLVLSGHCGPVGLQTFLFKILFGVSLGSFILASNKSSIKKKQPLLRVNRINQIIKATPIYCRGEEKSLLKGLLRGEWISFLNDLNMHATRPHNCRIAGQDFALSEFPFRIALKYDIALLFVKVVRSRDNNRTVISIRPFGAFSDPNEGLKLYAEYLEQQILEDPYSARKYVRSALFNQTYCNSSGDQAC